MLLEQQAQSRLPGIDTFVAAEAFKVGNKIDGRTLSAIAWNFSRHFLGVAERHVPEMQITAWTLLYTASDKWILESLAEQPDGSTCVLANIHSLMTLGHKALNHLDGQSNFAYVRSPVDHRLWAVHWFVNSANEWIIGAVYVPHPQSDWRAGSRLFASRNMGESVFYPQALYPQKRSLVGGTRMSDCSNKRTSLRQRETPIVDGSDKTP